MHRTDQAHANFEPSAPESFESVESSVQVTDDLVLVRNFGLVDHGESHWWAAGTHFARTQYAELISRMAAAGAIFR